MHAVLLFIFLLMTLGGCQPSIYFFGGPPEPFITEEINCAEATSVIQEYTTELRHERHLYLDRAKTYCEGGINTIQLQFNSQDILDLCEARELIVHVTEGLLARVNQSPGLASQLSSFPFTSANLEIYITFESYFIRYIDPYYVRWISLEDDTVFMYAFDLYDDTKQSWHVKREDYETAREIVVYQTQAEERYQSLHKPNYSIFGNQRYYPPQVPPP